MRNTTWPAFGSRLRPSVLACGIVITVTTFSAAADQTEELARLHRQAVQLRHALEEVEAKIQAIDSQNRNPAVSKDAIQPEARRGDAAPVQRTPNAGSASPSSVPSSTSISSLGSLKRNWSQVQRGMREDGVQALLGKPERVLRIDGNPVWYYAYPGVGRGSVFFNGDGRVSSAQSPTLGW